MIYTHVYLNANDLLYIINTININFNDKAAYIEVVKLIEETV
jgi:hypothetical protein